MVRDQGPLPFERFMELALYHPEHGFFSATRVRSTRSGDFLTSPEVSRLFGESLAVLVERELHLLGSCFLLVEAGAGSGSLLEALLSRVEVDAWAVEASPPARRSLGRRLPGVTVAEHLPGEVRGVILANELLDNLPMALAQRQRDGWRERWVGSDAGRLVFVDAPPREEVVGWLDAYAGPVPEGGWVEVQLSAAQWIEDALGRLAEGLLVVFDYGDTAQNLLPRRRDGTLRTYRSHHLGPHPLEDPGRTDITADVNFTALLDVAEQSGARVELHRQDDFLTGLGLRHRLSDLRHQELEAARRGDEMERLRIRALRTEAETLLHPRGLGDFRVMEARKGNSGTGAIASTS